uniref:Uncharacterized protein n=1 Tax=Glossina austeni TaxID=7395 RepID=A0A1A9UYU5_GLOAU
MIPKTILVRSQLTLQVSSAKPGVAFLSSISIRLTGNEIDDLKYDESIGCTTAIINSVNLMVTAIACFDELTNYEYGRVHVTDERIRNDKYLRITINKNQPTTTRDSREYQNSIIKIVN